MLSRFGGLVLLVCACSAVLIEQGLIQRGRNICYNPKTDEVRAYCAMEDCCAHHRALDVKRCREHNAWQSKVCCDGRDSECVYPPPSDDETYAQCKDIGVCDHTFDTWKCYTDFDESDWSDGDVLSDDGDLVLSNVIYSNLDGKGPDDDQNHGLVFGNVFPKSGQYVKLNITVDPASQYEGNHEKNGLDPRGPDGQKIGRVYVKGGTNVTLVFKLEDENGRPVVKDRFALKMMDIDRESREEVSIDAGSYASVRKGERVHQETGHGKETFSILREAVFNEKLAQSSSELHEAQTVSFVFRSRGMFKFNFKVPYFKGNNVGRNFKFAGAPSLACESWPSLKRRARYWWWPKESLRREPHAF